MFAKIEITIKAARYCDLSKTATLIHHEMFSDAFNALKERGFEPQVEELCLKQSDVLQAMRDERE